MADGRRALLMGAAWVMPLGVAEWAIRKRPAREPAGRARMAAAVVPAAMKSA